MCDLHSLDQAYNSYENVEHFLVYVPSELKLTLLRTAGSARFHSTLTNCLHVIYHLVLHSWLGENSCCIKFTLIFRSFSLFLFLLCENYCRCVCDAAQNILLRPYSLQLKSDNIFLGENKHMTHPQHKNHIIMLSCCRICRSNWTNSVSICSKCNAG